MQCRQCGASNPDDYQFCGECGVSLYVPIADKYRQSDLARAWDAVKTWATLDAPIHQTPVVEQPDPTATLQSEILRYVSRGYQVISQTDSTAQLVKPKHVSCLIVLLLLVLSPFTVGITLILLILYYFTLHDEQMYLMLAPDGRVRRK